MLLQDKMMLHVMNGRRSATKEPLSLRSKMQSWRSESGSRDKRRLRQGGKVVVQKTMALLEGRRALPRDEKPGLMDSQSPLGIGDGIVIGSALRF
jgi:hypothetical protein